MPSEPLFPGTTSAFETVNEGSAIPLDLTPLLRDLARDMGVALILITHNMSVVAEMVDWVPSMGQGRDSTVDICFRSELYV